jgi:hypothetical protein
MTVAPLAAGAYNLVLRSGLGGDPGDDTVALTVTPTCSTTTLIRAPTQTATVGVAITPMVHAWTGQTPDSIKVRTALPDGLSAHPATGTISGTATASSAKTGYRVVGYACSDSSVVWDTLTVTPTCSTTTLIRAPTQTAIVGVAITPMVHSWLHATPDSIKVRTTLPAGLSAHPATGTISGTATTRSAMAGYRVVGYACSDSSVVFDSIRVTGYPLFTKLLHPAGWIGYADTIVGTRFGASGFTASLSGTAVTISRQTDDSLFWTVPTKARGTYNFIGLNSDGLADTVSFRVLVPAAGTTVP